MERVEGKHSPAQPTSGSVTVTPIGVIRSPFKSMEEVPIQPFFSKALGEVEVFQEYAEGLKDVEGFSHIILLYVFHRAERGYALRIRPFLDKTVRGVFATRYHRRPNPLGLSVVELRGRRGPTLKIRRVDVVDGTPLLDIKPYVSIFDAARNVKIGWLEGKMGSGKPRFRGH